MDILAIYIHLPFCRKICPFCSFAVLTDRGQKHKHYFDLLKKELTLLRQTYPLDFSQVQSIYIGGGTPSRLGIDEMEQLVFWLRQNVASNKNIQWSIEVNPEDVSFEYAHHLKQLEFTRISLGVQSFSTQNLKKLGRQHGPEHSRSAIQALQKVGFKDINFDLLFGYPGQSIDSLTNDLTEFAFWNPTHVSAYCLTIEKKTLIYKKSAWKQWQLDNESLIVVMYETLVHFLEDIGCYQYEISNFATEGCQSRQNKVYWSGDNYLGIGMGSHSLQFPYRWGNYRRWVDYKKNLEKNELPFEFCEELDTINQRDEALMIPLRLKKGLDLAEFSEKYRLNLAEIWGCLIKKLQRSGLAKIERDHLKLTTRGMLMADEITVALAALIS